MNHNTDLKSGYKSALRQVARELTSIDKEHFTKAELNIAQLAINAGVASFRDGDYPNEIHLIVS